MIKSMLRRINTVQAQQLLMIYYSYVVVIYLLDWPSTLGQARFRTKNFTWFWTHEAKPIRQTFLSSKTIKAGLEGLMIDIDFIIISYHN